MGTIAIDEIRLLIEVEQLRDDLATTQAERDAALGEVERLTAELHRHREVVEALLGRAMSGQPTLARIFAEAWLARTDTNQQDAPAEQGR